MSSILKSITICTLSLTLLTFAGCKKSDDADTTKSTTSETSQSDTSKSTSDDTVKTIPTDYPLTTCVISKKKLDDHGEPYIHNHNGTEVRFCCEPCLDDFNADPEKHIATILAAKAAKTDK